MLTAPSSAASLGGVCGRPCLSGEGVGSCWIQDPGAAAASPSPARCTPRKPSSSGGVAASTVVTVTMVGEAAAVLVGPALVGVPAAPLSLYQCNGRTTRTATVSPEIARFCDSPCYVVTTSVSNRQRMQHLDEQVVSDPPDGDVSLCCVGEVESQGALEQLAIGKVLGNHLGRPVVGKGGGVLRGHWLRCWLRCCGECRGGDGLQGAVLATPATARGAQASVSGTRHCAGDDQA